MHAAAGKGLIQGLLGLISTDVMQVELKDRLLQGADQQQGLSIRFSDTAVQVSTWATPAFIVGVQWAGDACSACALHLHC